VQGSRTEARSTNEQGVVAVELVLVLPFLLLLLFGIIQFGRAYNAKIMLSGAVREGVRVLALDSGDAEAVTKAAAPGLDEASIDVDTSTPVPCTSGTDAWVTATYPFDLDVPFWSSSTITISATGVMRCGG
jgi:Flp pilus assembly protein TadG